MPMQVRDCGDPKVKQFILRSSPQSFCQIQPQQRLRNKRKRQKGCKNSRKSSGSMFDASDEVLLLFFLLTTCFDEFCVAGSLQLDDSTGGERQRDREREREGTEKQEDAL